MMRGMSKTPTPEPLITWYAPGWRKWALTVEGGTATASGRALIKSAAPRAVFDLAAVVGVSSGSRGGRMFVTVITTGAPIDLPVMTVWRARRVANCIDEARRTARGPAAPVR